MSLLPALLLLPGLRAEIPPEAVAEAIRRHVAGEVGVALEDVEVMHLGLTGSLDCPDGTPMLVETAYNERFQGHTRLRVTAGDAGSPCADVRLRTRLRVWVRVPVAATPVAAGDRVPVELGRVPLERVDGETIPLDEVGGAWLARVPLRAGAPVLAGAVRPLPAAFDGEEVILEGAVGELSIRAPGRLLGDAYVGAEVQVINLATHVVQRGTFGADGVVRLSLPLALPPLAPSEDGT